jgi:hypothetical protein
MSFKCSLDKENECDIFNNQLGDCELESEGEIVWRCPFYKDIEVLKKEINAKREGMFLFQILEEHINKCKKHFEPCQDCIRLGLNKGFNEGYTLAKAEMIKVKPIGYLEGIEVAKAETLNEIKALLRKKRECYREDENIMIDEIDTIILNEFLGVKE